MKLCLCPIWGHLTKIKVKYHQHTGTIYSEAPFMSMIYTAILSPSCESLYPGIWYRNKTILFYISSVLKKIIFQSGGHHKFNHYFRGYLAGLSVLKGKTESERVIRCLNNCQENLDFSALSAMHSGTVSCSLWLSCLISLMQNFLICFIDIC